MSVDVSEMLVLVYVEWIHVFCYICKMYYRQYRYYHTWSMLTDIPAYTTYSAAIFDIWEKTNKDTGRSNDVHTGMYVNV